MDLSINPECDVTGLKTGLARNRRGRMDAFLSDSAANRLFEALTEQKDWNLQAYTQGRHINIDYNGMKQRPREEWDRLKDIVHAEARHGFGYFFCNVPLYDIAHHGKFPGHPLLAAYRLMNSPRVLDIVREATGARDISFADAQATKFLPGHFLTAHDDDVCDKNRRAAYVLSMTKTWRADWGGQLQFFDDEGHVDRAFVPGFNALSIFLVPQNHAVSALSAFADAPRLSITGWFRTGDDPGPD